MQCIEAVSLASSGWKKAMLLEMTIYKWLDEYLIEPVEMFIGSLFCV